MIGLDWVTPYLAVGPKPRLQSTPSEGPTWENLRANGVTQIIDLADSALERRYARTYKIAYKAVKIRDHPDPEKLFAVFQRIHTWIEKERKADGKVYLHCWGGTGRSPTCAMTHLMASGRTRQEAMDLVKNAHDSTWRGENIDKMEEALWEVQLGKPKMDLFGPSELRLTTKS